MLVLDRSKNNENDEITTNNEPIADEEDLLRSGLKQLDDVDRCSTIEKYNVLVLNNINKC